MTKEQLALQINNLSMAIEELRDRADHDQRITHNAHYSKYFDDCLNILENELDGNRALLKRVETVGR